MLDGTNEEEEDLLTSLIRWFYIAEEYDQLCSYLQTWDFEFGITDDYGLIIQLKDFLKDIKLPKLNTAEIIPLSEIHASSFREYIERLPEYSEIDKHLSDNMKDYDGKVSCCYLENSKIIGALLVKRVSDDYVEIRKDNKLSEVCHHIQKYMPECIQDFSKRFSRRKITISIRIFRMQKYWN